MTDLFGFLILLATSASLVAYLAASLAAIKLGTGTTAMPVFAVAALFSLWALWGAGYEAMGWGAVLLASGIPIYFIARASRAPAESLPASPG